MILKQRSLYECMFLLLVEYWKQKEFDDLGAFLGAINLGLTMQKIPFDDKIISDWNSLFDDKNKISDHDSFLLVIQFISLQNTWLKLEGIINDLKSSYKNENNWWLVWKDLLDEKGINTVYN